MFSHQLKDATKCPPVARQAVRFLRTRILARLADQGPKLLRIRAGIFREPLGQRFVIAYQPVAPVLGKMQR